VANGSGPTSSPGRAIATSSPSRRAVSRSSTVVDANRYANDATTEFFNWALFASGAYDYPADTRGYTWGVLADLAVDWWSLRGGIALVPFLRELPTMDWRIGKSRGLMAEYEVRYKLRELPGASSLLLFLNSARMGSYEQVLENPRSTATTSRRRAKTVEPSTGLLSPSSSSSRIRSGLHEAQLERRPQRVVGVHRDRPLDRRRRDAKRRPVEPAQRRRRRRRRRERSFGPSQALFGPAADTVFIIGDGALAYAPEIVGDFYYRFHVSDLIAFSAMYQPVINPAYNSDADPFTSSRGASCGILRGWPCDGRFID